jgi:hypothetical protein
MLLEHEKVNREEMLEDIKRGNQLYSLLLVVVWWQ